MQLTKTTKMEATAHSVWDVFAHRFNDAQEWLSSVPRSYGQEREAALEGAPSAGRICELQPDGRGMKASERFVAYDETNRTCSVRVDFVDAPSVFPVHHASLDFSVVDDPDGGATATWAFGAKLKPWGYLMWPLLWKGFSTGWSQMCEELKHYVETGTPHPRKVAASKRASSASGS